LKAAPKILITLSAFAYLAAPAQADWSLREDGKPAKVNRAGLEITPQGDWNRWSASPSKRGEIWTIDGLSLNELTVFGGILNGEAIYRETDKKDNPLPKFKSDMLPPDLVELFEASTRIVLQTSIFEVSEVEPAKLDGKDAVRFTYKYAVENDQLIRKGEAVAAVVDGRLYLINFVAPEIHYFDRDVENFHDMAASIKLAKAK
jgi:hypothetical protein